MLITAEFQYDDFFRMPTIAIGIDNVVLYNNEVQSVIDLSCNIQHGAHEFWIQHYGKQPEETSPDHDTHVVLKRLLFDQIDLDQIDYCRLTHRARYYPDYNPDYVRTLAQQGVSLPQYIVPNHYFGHNGTWRLPFSAPILSWIITEQNPSGMNLEDTMFSSSQSTLQQVKDFFKL